MTPSLSVYVPLGYPDLAASIDRALDAAAAGAGWLELGFPFSDPAADGPVIEKATQAALRGGTTYQDCLQAVASIRAHTSIPLIVMTYANVAYARGWEGFAAEIAHAGATGCLLADVPLEESGPIRKALASHHLAWVPLVSPLTPADRMRAIAATCTGFVYVVSSLGITGQTLTGPVEETVQRLQAVTDLPIAVGFGIQGSHDVRRIADLGAAAIVGTHLVSLQHDAPAYRQALSTLMEGLDA